MLAVIKGDIISSRKITNQEKWLKPLKSLFAQWGDNPKQWELVWGDFFQLEILHPEDALLKALTIKALLKNIPPADEQKTNGIIDVRMAIGIGEKDYSGDRISESNGSAFINAGDRFETLKKENRTIGVKSPFKDFDEEINLYLKLVGLFMDKWSLSSAGLIEVVLHHPHITQKEIGQKLGIKQSAVSGRWKRANVNELLAVENIFHQKVKALLP